MWELSHVPTHFSAASPTLYFVTFYWTLISMDDHTKNGLHLRILCLFDTLYWNLNKLYKNTKLSLSDSTVSDIYSL